MHLPGHGGGAGPPARTWGEDSSFTHTLAGHLGTASQPSQIDKVKTVGRCFRLPGHQPHHDLVMLPIEVVSARDPFLLRVHETFVIGLFKTQKRTSVFVLY